MTRVSSKPRVDLRRSAIALTASLVVLGGALIQWSPAPQSEPDRAQAIDPAADPAGHAAQLREREIELRFAQATVMLHSGQHEYAVAALHGLLALAPRMPEAHVNMGYALIGLAQPTAARDFFASAIELNPMQANAYYGLAMAFDELGQRPEAIGAMRSYLHLARSEDPRHLAKARAALWEWEAVAPASAAVPAR